MKIPASNPAPVESMSPAAAKRGGGRPPGASAAPLTPPAAAAPLAARDGAKVTISPQAANSKKIEDDYAEGDHLMAQVESGKLAPADHERAMKRVAEILSQHKQS